MLIVSWIVTFVLGWIVYHLTKHVLKIMRLPPGPLPLPLIGNLLSFLKSGSSREVLSEYAKEYGHVYTVWFGKEPCVIVTGWEETKDALVNKRNDFAGRPHMGMTDILMPNALDIFMCDYGKKWEVMSKVGHSAIRKYMNSDKLPELVYEVVNETTKDMLKDGVLCPFSSIYLIVFNILASSAFSTRFGKYNKDFWMLMANNDEFHELMANGFPPDFIPALKPFYGQLEKDMRRVTSSTQAYFRKQFVEHQTTYKTGHMRDFTDAVLSAREEAEKEDSSYLPYLDDESLIMIIGDLFSAGSDTTQATLKWLFLYLAALPEIQEKSFQEINQQIGNRMAIDEEKQRCPYTCAVISEALRIKSALFLGAPHKTICDSNVGNYKIPQNTTVFFFADLLHNNPKYWSDPSTFKPERFLDEEGNYLSKSPDSYLPFGLGRRACIGQSMARTDVFLILVGILQKCLLQLDDDQEANFEPKESAITCEPLEYQLLVTPRNN